MTKTVLLRFIAFTLFCCFILPKPAIAQINLSLPTSTEEPIRVEVARIRSGILPGVVVGGHYDGILRILQEPYTAAGELDEELEDSLRGLLEDELSLAGFDVVRSHPNSVFEEQLVEDLEPGRFLLGGTITRASLNTYSSLFKNSTQDERSIRWEVFDREVAKVVYRKEITGSAEVEGLDNPAATYEAIRNSLRSLLDQPELQEVLERPVAMGIASAGRYRIQALPTPHSPLPIEQIAGKAIPSIVQIRVSGGKGTGFLLNTDGLVVTNQHVVGSAFSVKVDFYDGSTQTGRVLKRDRRTDAALVKLEEPLELVALPMCHTNAVRVGEGVVAIGNPLSLSNTVTQGIVSGIRRGRTRSLIQTDAAVNPGNSGGPLLNRQGAVVGIVTQKIASEGVEGLSFALPIGEVLERLGVEISAPRHAELDSCGNPVA